MNDSSPNTVKLTPENIDRITNISALHDICKKLFNNLTETKKLVVQLKQKNEDLDIQLRCSESKTASLAQIIQENEDKNKRNLSPSNAIKKDVTGIHSSSHPFFSYNNFNYGFQSNVFVTLAFPNSI